MNTLLYALFGALRHHRWLRWLSCAFIFTSLGNGLTQVVILGLLLDWNTPGSLLTLAWLFATLPGFAGSLLGEKLCQRFSPFAVLIVAEVAGLLALLFPLAALHFHSVSALLMVQSMEALLGGMSWPALTLLFKRGLTQAELPAATCLENIIFASQVLLGTGVGVMLYQEVSPKVLLAFDAASFAGSLLMLRLAGGAFAAPHGNAFAESTPPPALRWRTLKPAQKRALLMLPALAAVGAPAMSLLPALAQQISPSDATGLALPLLFARSMGQLCGPLLLKKEQLPRYASQNRILLSCLSIFLLAYGVVPFLTGLQTLASGMIFIAHVASNIVFAVGTFGILHHFQTASIAEASGKAWRWQTVSGACFTCITALVSARLGATGAFYTVSGCTLVLVAILALRYQK